MLYLLVIHCSICFNFIKATDKPVPCKKIRIRKEVNNLSPYETEVLTQAFRNALYKTTKGMKFEDLASYHGAPNIICKEGWVWNGMDYKYYKDGCCPHPTLQLYIDFIIWHRLYVGMSNKIH